MYGRVPFAAVHFFAVHPDGDSVGVKGPRTGGMSGNNFNRK